ncbi:MAG: hypothetical protein QME74_01210 [Candidatus Edwardsbacteria bacterium]|nr:hypothetical protein [Candidatus Edwardsbacteria bacterium]
MFWKKKTAQPQGKGITIQHGVVANALTTEALISVLIKKNVCTKDEILDEIKKISDATRARSEKQN